MVILVFLLIEHMWSFNDIRDIQSFLWLMLVYVTLNNNSNKIKCTKS